MAYSSRPHHVGVGIGGIGVAFSLLVTALVFLIPRYLLPTATAQAYLETWMVPILSVAVPVERFGIPLLAALVAFSLVRARDHPARDVVAGFVLGGVVLGLGVALLDWGVTHPSFRATALTYAFDALRRAGLFAGAALLGALGGTLAESQHEGPESL